jgi:hypothetical protein
VFSSQNCLTIFPELKHIDSIHHVALQTVKRVKMQKPMQQDAKMQYYGYSGNLILGYFTGICQNIPLSGSN